MPRFTPGQLVVLPDNEFGTVRYMHPHYGTVYVERQGGGTIAPWSDQVLTRAEALRAAARLAARIGNDVEAYKLVDLIGELAVYVEDACKRADELDRQAAGEVTA